MVVVLVPPPRRLDRISMSTSFFSFPPSPNLFNMDGWLFLVLICDEIFILETENINTFPVLHADLMFLHRIIMERLGNRNVGSSYLTSAAHYRHEKLRKSCTLSGTWFSLISEIGVLMPIAKCPWEDHVGWYDLSVV